MEVQLQKCHKCRSMAVHNLLVRDVGQPRTVYVRCGSCGEFLAQYRLGDYLDPGKGIESWLQSQGSAAQESGRDFLGEFERVKTAAIEGFNAATAKLQEQELHARQETEPEQSKD